MPHFLCVRAPAARRAVVAGARRMPDYAARRSGGDPENQRRYSRGVSSQSYSAPSRRKSVDYSARRAGGEEENNRRRGGSYSPPAPESRSNGAYGGGRESSYGGGRDSSYGGGRDNYSRSSGGGNLVSDAVAKRRSMDYSSRGRGDGGVSRSSDAPRRSSSNSYSSYSGSSSSSYGSGGGGGGGRDYNRSSGGNKLVSDAVAKRRSMDYSSRGRGDGGVSRSSDAPRRSSSQSYSSPSYGSGGGGGYNRSSDSNKLVSDAVAKRRSMDFSSRGRGDGGVSRSADGPRRSSSQSYSSPSSSKRGGSDYSRSSGKNNLVSDAVAKRRSMDYSSRGRGDGGASRSSDAPRRSSGNYSSPSSYSNQGSGGSKSNLVSPQVLKRRSIDYSARRSGSRGRR